MFEKYITQLLVSNVFDFEDDKVMMLKKIPFVMFPARSMARFIQTISEDLGSETAEKLGYNAGRISGENLIKENKWFNTSFPGRITSLIKMLEVVGFGNMNLKIYSIEQNKALINITNHPTIDWGNRIYGEKELTCKFYMAIFSAHANIELGLKNCHLIETQCICKGAKFCEWSYNVFKDKQEEANKSKPVLDTKPAVNTPAITETK